MNTILSIVLATTVISLLSLIGVIALAFSKKFLQKITLLLVALSAGVLMGGAFLHLIPESLNYLSSEASSLLVLAGFIFFLLVEKILHWRHCHKENCHIHSFAYINLFGDAIHNFIDGLIIAASFLTNPFLGINTTIAVALHEIPQEIGDFGVLVHGGFSRTKALVLNLLISFTAIAGGLIGYFFINKIGFLTQGTLPLAAGGFIYIAASDLIPELRKENGFHKSALTFVIFLIGIGIMALLRD